MVNIHQMKNQPTKFWTVSRAELTNYSATPLIKSSNIGQTSRVLEQASKTVKKDVRDYRIY